MAHDGKVVISTALDNSDIPKGVKEISGCYGGLKNTAERTAKAMSDAFKSAQKEISAAQKQMQSAESAKIPLVEQSAELGAKLDEAKAKLAELQKQQASADAALNAPMDRMLSGQEIEAYVDAQAKKPELDAAVNEQQKTVDELQKEWDTVNDKVDQYNTKISQANQKVQEQTEKVEELSEETKEVQKASTWQGVVNSKTQEKMWQPAGTAKGSATAVLPGVQKSLGGFEKILKAIKGHFSGMGKAAGGFSSRLNSIVSGAFVFNLISAALRKVTDYLGKAISSSDEMKSALANLKGAAATAAAPIIQILTPALAALANAVATVFSYLAQLISFFTGQSVSAMARAAKGVETSAGSAKKAVASLAGFDEITKLDDGKNGGGGGSGSDINYDFQGQSSIMETIVGKIQEMIAPLLSIDLNPVIEAFQGLGSALTGLGETIWEHLEWAWFNILVPLAEWTIEELAPVAVNTLATAFQTLNKWLQPVWSGMRSLMDKLKPVAKFIGDSVVSAVEWLGEEFEGLGDMFEENGPLIEETIKNLGDIFAVVWQVLEPILTAFRDITREIISLLIDLAENRLSYFIKKMNGLSKVISGIATGDWKKAWEGMGQLCKTEIEDMTADMETLAESFGIDCDIISDVTETAMENVGTFFSDAWSLIVDVWDGASTWFSGIFSSISATASDVFHNIGVLGEGCWVIIQAGWEQAGVWFAENVTGPIEGYLTELWDSAPDWAHDAWEEIKDVFSTVASYFETIFSDAWQAVADVFSPGGINFNAIISGIGNTFKDIMNGVIDGINDVIAAPFNAINSFIRTIRWLYIPGVGYPFKGLASLSVPEIPHLAQGAVLPPNKPFLAMVGDQKHGTNIEAPLTTIQEAVALVMGDQITAMMAGFEALLAENQALRRVVEQIEVGDETIGEAAMRHQTRMAVMRGG